MRERRFYRALLADLDRLLIFDVGASAGTKAEIFARYGRVVCVEPSPTAAAALRARFSGVSRVDVVEAAAAARSGTATFWEFEPASALQYGQQEMGGGSDRCRREPLRHAAVAAAGARRRDGEHRCADRTVRQPAYLKIDAEGSDWPVIQRLSQSCHLVSAEFNLPEFHAELRDAVARLTELTPGAVFNAAVAEPPVAFEWPDWKSGRSALAAIESAGWRYVELFCLEGSLG